MENAIIMASGLGQRMQPMTKTTPKPLIAVHGKPMIETVIEGLLRRETIKQIYVVVGYLGEQFKYLEWKYPAVRLIKNSDYRTINNISSVYAASSVLNEGNCFICEADLYISAPSIFDAELEYSCYFGKFVSGYSQDWVFEQDSLGIITRVGKGGDDCYNMVGIAYFTAEDAKTLAQSIKTAYGQPGYETKFWDDIVNENLDRLRMYVRPIEAKQITEIDTIAELEAENKKK